MRPIPEVVFQHFRRPHNKGAMKDPSGTGVVDGRSKDSKLKFHIRLDGDEKVEEATFETKRDRASDAPLSMLTCHIKGMSLPELDALTVEEFGAVYELFGEQVPMLLLAYEALQATIANIKGLPNPFAFEGGVVCTCVTVREGRLRRVIRERELKNLSEVQHWTRACTGCRSCRPEVERIIREEQQVV